MEVISCRQDGASESQEAIYCFCLKTYPPQKGERELAETVKEISRTKYGRPREEVEREVAERQEKPLF